LSDAAVPEVADLVRGRGQLNKPTDADYYRSFASIPLMLDEASQPRGVLVATSNVPGRFDLANSKVLRNAAIVLTKLFKEIDI
jgi:hypothetical protein